MILQGDCLEVLKAVKDNTIDGLVTDPPYGIAFMGKNWDFFNGEEYNGKNKFSEDEEYKKNFLMKNGNSSSAGMIQFFTPIWKEVYRVMKPGAFGFVCCIPRQDCLSRMMISLEDAGFNINFTSLYWTYATGFPKALHIGKAIDKRLEKKRKVVGKNPRIATSLTKTDGFLGCLVKDKTIAGQITAPASEEAKKMEGSYGGFQPKPAVEVIIVVMKPRSEPSYVDQALTDGKGVVWFDDCRIPYVDEQDEESVRNSHNAERDYIRFNLEMKYQPDPKDIENNQMKGRFPANLLVSDDVLDDVSRFFSLDAWAEKNLPFLIVPKPSMRERQAGCLNLDSKKRPVHLGQLEAVYGIGELECKNNHPTVKPIELMSYLITMGTRPGDVILDPFAGSFTTGCACYPLERKFVGIEKEEEYIKIGKARLDYYKRLPLLF